MDNPNRLSYDADYAAESPFGQIVAPQSFFGGGSGTGAGPAIQGNIPGSHMLQGGDEFWFYGPRVFPGDKLSLDGMCFDYRVTNTAFAGPTLFTRGDTTYVNQEGQFIAKQRFTSIRYLVSNMRKQNTFAGQEKDPEWTDEQLEDIYKKRLVWIRSFPGHRKRLWGDIQVGEEMTVRVVGPHSVQSFTSEQRTAHGGWGSTFIGPHFPTSTMDAGWLPEMSLDRERAAEDPGVTDQGLGPDRGHMQPTYARVIGMPRSYGWGPTLGVWCLDYVANWAGDHGFVLHHNTQYRNPALTGNVAYVSGSVTDKFVNEQFGQHIVQLAYEMKTHEGTLMARGAAEVVLPES